MADDKPPSALAEKTTVVVFSRVLTTLIDIATLILLVRLLTKDAMAVIGFLFLLQQTARHFATFGLPESVFFFFEKVEPGARRTFALQTVGLLGAFGTLTAVVIGALALLAPLILTNWSASNLILLQRLMPWIALVALLETPTWLMNNVLLALDRQKQAAWYQIVMSSVTFVVLTGPILIGWGLSVAVYGLAAYSVMRFVVSLVWFQRVLPGPSKPLPAGTLKEQLKFAVPLGINSFTARLNKYIDKWVVSVLLAATTFADYQVGGQEIPLITTIPYAVGSVFISRYVRLQLEGKRDELLALWYQAVEGVALIVIPLAMLFIAIAYDFITLVFGQRYAAAVIPFQIYTVILLHRVAQYGSTLQAYADTGAILRYTLVLLGTNLVLSVPLTLVLGINGTALGTLLAALVGWMLYLRRIGYHLQVGFGRALPWKRYLRILFVAGAAGAVSWLLRFQVLTSLPQVAALVIAIFVFIAIYASAGTLTGAVRKEHWSVAWDWVRLKFLWS